MSASSQCHHPDLHIELNHVRATEGNVHFVEVKATCNVCSAPMIFQVDAAEAHDPARPVALIDRQVLVAPLVGWPEESSIGLPSGAPAA